MKQYTIGIDIGGSKMAAVLLNSDRKVVVDFQLATPKDTLDHFLIMIKALLEPLQEKAKADQAEIIALGLGVPAKVDQGHQKILDVTHLPILNNIKLGERLNKQLGLNWPIKMDNDVNCFVRAECLLGAGQGLDNVYGITIGTGIGAGWWLNGQVYTGAHGGAGEICDMIIDLDHKITLEQAYHKLTQNNPKLLALEAYEGDLLAEKSFTELGEYLGITLANIVNALDPGLFVIGGGASASSELFLDTATETMAQYITCGASKKTKVVKSKLKRKAGAIGAALLFAPNS